MDRYQRIKPKSVSQQVFEQLRELIYRAQLKPGEQLLPERELAAALGVSRPTLRQAIHKLVDRGLLDHRQGQGTFVRSLEDRLGDNPLSAVIDDHEASLLELLEVRLALECNAAVLAARRATAEDIRAVSKACADMAERVQKGGRGSSDDLAFHMAVAYASKNPVQINIMKNLYDMVHQAIQETLTQLYQNPQTLLSVVAQHQAVARAIEKGDEQAAFKAMHDHISFLMAEAGLKEREG